MLVFLGGVGTRCLVRGCYLFTAFCGAFCFDIVTEAAFQNQTNRLPRRSFQSPPIPSTNLNLGYNLNQDNLVGALDGGQEILSSDKTPDQNSRLPEGIGKGDRHEIFCQRSIFLYRLPDRLISVLFLSLCQRFLFLSALDISLPASGKPTVLLGDGV